MTTRRHFLKKVATGSFVAALPDWLPPGLQRVARGDTQLGPDHVRFSDDIEPIVRLLEQTPRDQLLEEIAARVKGGGLNYCQVVAALMLAGIRNVQPRPNVGFKFHTVLVVNSAHLASVHSPDAERWLPIFWALDYFKQAQAEDAGEGDWTMPAVRESQLPSFSQARTTYQQAMDQWDPEKADAAIASWSQVASENELFACLARYGSRDFRDIGHKAIYVANAFRTLNCIGWRHAEPILRSLTYALQCRGGDPNPATHDLPADRAGRRNQELVTKVRKDWQAGKVDAKATRRLNSLFYAGEPAEAADAVVEALNAGVAPQSIYDALYLTAGELLMRQPGIIALHAVTSTNALGYAYRRVASPDLRLELMLQNASFLAHFLERMQRREVAERTIGHIEASTTTTTAGAMSESDRIASILEQVGRDNSLASREVMQLLADDPSAAPALIDAARRMVFLKGTNSHDYKFSSAVLEDYYHISPAFRDAYLATSVYHWRGAGEPDSRLLPRIRSVLA